MPVHLARGCGAEAIAGNAAAQHRCRPARVIERIDSLLAATSGASRARPKKFAGRVNARRSRVPIDGGTQIRLAAERGASLGDYCGNRQRLFTQPC